MLNEIAEAKTKRTKTADPLGVVSRSVCDGVELAAAEVQGMRLSAIEGSGTTAAEYGELVAGLVYRAVSINALRNSECGAARAGSGDEFGCGTRAETGEMGGVVPGRKDF